MKIENNKVVAINYTLTDNDGNVIDSSEGRDPLAYVHGTGSLIPGLEEELEGKVVTDKLKVTVAPEKAYGGRDENLLQEVPRENFAHVPEIKPGMQFQANNGQGGVLMVTVMQVDEKIVIVDGNHPLAGVTLNFDVEVMEVREASKEEMDHGHVHGPGGHQH